MTITEMQNRLNNPGSIESPYGSVQQFTQVIGSGGQVRHSGYFSTDNPYLSQLNSATRNQDKDALYERAVEWEADYANRQMQLEENRAILEEQREYDSPLAQVERARAAGINPDLEGSGGSGYSSGSQAQLANPGMADQQGQTKFANQYDDVNLVLNGISTAATFAGSLMSGVSGIMNSVANLQILPSEIALNTAQAGLHTAQANEINQMLPGKKKSLDLQNGMSILGTLASFADVIAPDTEDMAPHLKALGVADDQIPAYTDFIKQMHANPQMREKYASANVGARWAEAEDQVYTAEVVSSMTEIQKKTAMEKQLLDYSSSVLQRNIADLLNTQDYAQEVSDVKKLETQVTGQTFSTQQSELKLRAAELEHNLGVHLTNLYNRATTLTTIDSAIKSIQDGAKGRALSSHERAQISTLVTEKMALEGVYSDEFYKIRDAMANVVMSLYFNNEVLDSKGNIIDLAKLEKVNYFADLTFNGFITHYKPGSEHAKDWVRIGIDAAEVGVQAAAVARGYDFNTTYRDVHSDVNYKRGFNAALKGIR